MSSAAAGEQEGSSPTSELPILIDVGSTFEGVVSCRAGVRIDGSLTGEVVAQGRIELGEASKVTGTVRAAEIVAAGRVEGTLVASDRIELLATANVNGDLTTGTLVAREGCTVQGSCSMAQATEPIQQPRSPS